MYKAGKQWLFDSLATVTLLGGAASSLDSTFLSHFAPNLMSKVSADDASGLNNIKFDTREDALIGTWVVLVCQ
ncbi:KxYKxGKxW signal peptide domain-containing protein [Fructobacillus fructosus]|nr:KxYKxGKxW signal peptide domain-containing protein [Fructobacillus fructosus]MBD9366325.1 KxYKxGKxW signal peptide domain-containing protein [Leuconostoc mesenteroides]